MPVATADNFIAENWKYLLVAAVLHVAMGAAMVIGIERAPKVVQPASLAIKATIVDNSAQRRQREREAAERQAREQAEAERKAREQADLAAMLEAEEQRKAEQRVQEQRVQEQKAEELRRTQAAEQQRKAEQARREEQTRQAAAQKAAQEKKRLAEIKAKQEAQAKAARDAREQAQREAELKRQLADEEGRMQAENAGLLNQYVALIQQRVIRNWNKPASARPGTQCDVRVTQAPGGTVLSVEINRCNGDEAVRQSIEAAVHRSSPLPPPPDARLFQRVIVFVFKPSE